MPQRGTERHAAKEDALYENNFYFTTITVTHLQAFESNVSTSDRCFAIESQVSPLRAWGCPFLCWQLKRPYSLLLSPSIRWIGIYLPFVELESKEAITFPWRQGSKQKHPVYCGDPLLEQPGELRTMRGKICAETRDSGYLDHVGLLEKSEVQNISASE